MPRLLILSDNQKNINIRAGKKSQLNYSIKKIIHNCMAFFDFYCYKTQLTRYINDDIMYRYENAESGFSGHKYCKQGVDCVEETTEQVAASSSPAAEQSSAGSEIDLRVILGVLKKNILPLILVTAIFAAGFFAYSKLFIKKQYSAFSVLLVNNKTENATVYNNTEITAAQNLADVYSIIIKSASVLQPVIEDKELINNFSQHRNMTYEKLRNSLNVSSVNDTQVIRISINNVDASYAKALIASIVSRVPDTIKEKVKSGSVNIIQPAKIDNNGKPVSPNATRNAIIGALIGFVITLAIAFIREFTNNTFKTEEDITNSLGIPLLGLIPAVDTKEFNKNV